MVVDIALGMALFSILFAYIVRQRKIAYVTVGSFLIAALAVIAGTFLKQWKGVGLLFHGGTFGEDYAALMVLLFFAYIVWALLLHPMERE